MRPQWDCPSPHPACITPSVACSWLAARDGVSRGAVAVSHQCASHHTLLLCSWGTVAIATAVMTVTFWAKADVGPYEWAEKQARRELQAEGLI